MTDMSRRERQLDELRHLCRSGAVGRAIDLAFEHFADFGPDDDVVELLAEALGPGEAAGAAHRRLTELRSSQH